MNKKILWAAVIMNAISIICWTFLAIVFNCWWIAFFSLLFLNDYRYEVPSLCALVCDKCGKRSREANSRKKALKKAQEDGWIHCEDIDMDYCPECMAAAQNVWLNPKTEYEE